MTDMKESPFDELLISVDVETAGPNPADYSLLTIGACTIFGKPNTFYVELKPLSMNALPEALAVSRLSMDRLAEHGLDAADGMRQFDIWLEEAVLEDKRPIFVAFNAPFDWMFVNDYFHRYLGRNPFGHSSLDIKSFYMGLSGVTWPETSMRSIIQRYLGNQQLTHHALRDAMDQAEIFRKMLAEADRKTKKDAN
jgi:DNA polymerase III epsilon subunit-like protein